MPRQLDPLLDDQPGVLSGAGAALARLIGSTEMVAQAKTEGGAYRLSFNDQFFIEAEDITHSVFRVSTRVVRLSHSLTTRESQALEALNLFSTIRHMLPNGISLAVSKHDRCLRLVMEMEVSPTEGRPVPDLTEFIQSAHAFRQLFVRNSTTNKV